MSIKVAGIICAAGASTRFGGARKKPFVDVDGRAAFLRSDKLTIGVGLIAKMNPAAETV